MTLHSSYLPSPSPSILKTLTYFRQSTTSQLRRLHYQGTPKGQKVRSTRHLKRLATLGLVKRVWGIYGGAPEYVYMMPDSKARAGNQHTLDIAELYVRLSTGHSTGVIATAPLIFDPEPWCHIQVGKMLLKPDAYVDTGKRFFIEMDEGTQYRAALAEKMRRYISAYDRWQEDRFPLVLFVVHDRDRKRFVESVIKNQSEPRLFAVCLFDDAVAYFGGR